MKFRVDYDRYLRQFDQLNGGITEDSQKVPVVGYKSFVSGEFLLSLMELSRFPELSKI